MTGDDLKHAAEQVADSKVATAAWRAFGGLAMTVMVGLSGFTLDAVYEAHAQIAAQAVQVQSLSVQVEKLSELLLTSRTLRDEQLAIIEDKIAALQERSAVHDLSITEMKAHLWQDDVKISAIWDDIASLRGQHK